MKRKHTYRWMLCLVTSCLFLSGCGSQSREQETGQIVEQGSGSGKDTELTQTEGTEKISAEETASATEKGKQVARHKIRDLDDAYEVILSSCKKEFIGSYAIDEYFLTWIHSQYGEDMVLKLAQAVADGEQDVDLWYQLSGKTIHVLWLEYCRDTGIQQYLLDQVYWKDCAGTDRVVIDFTGDINLAEGWCTTKHMDAMPNGIYDCFSQDLLSEMQSADIMVVNNEFTYSNRGTPVEGKDYVFRADPSRVKNLEAFGTDLAGLANNHVYDYGEEALLDTLDTLTNAEIPYVGAGRNLEEASRPVYFIANGRKIAIVAATQIERSTNYTREATDTSPGVLKTLDPEKFTQVIKDAKKNSDLVIAFVHWGTEGDSDFGADQVSLAKAFADAGADAIVGGHTHCLQGFSYVEDVPVIYSLGNFWFSQRTLDTGLLQLLIDTDGDITYRFLPCVQQDLKTSLVTDEQKKQEILSYMERISSGVTLDEDGYLIKN